MTRLEKDFVNRIFLPRLKRLPNSWVYKPPTKSIRGIPDILACVGGRFVALECKRKNAKADPGREELQKYVCRAIRLAGGIAFPRVDETNFLSVLEFLKDPPIGFVGFV